MDCSAGFSPLNAATAAADARSVCIQALSTLLWFAVCHTCRPMKLLRLFVAVVFKVFYITVLNFLLGTANCSWLAQDKVHYNFDFPSKSTPVRGSSLLSIGGACCWEEEGGQQQGMREVWQAQAAQQPGSKPAWQAAHALNCNCNNAVVCWWLCRAADCMAMPHLATLAISGVTAVVVIAVHGILSLAEVTPNPVSQNWLASAHSEVEVKTWVFKTAIVLAANILAGNHQVQAIIILLAAGWIVYVHIRYVSAGPQPGSCCRQGCGVEWRAPHVGTTLVGAWSSRSPAVWHALCG